MRRNVFTLSFFALALVCGASWPAEAPAAERRATLVVGRISSDVVKQLPRNEQFAVWLASKMGDVGISSGGGIVVRTKEEMAALLRAGKVDVFSETVFTTAWLQEQGLSEPVLREWKNGRAEYRSLLVARKDSGIRSIKDLRGKLVAFEDRGSTSSFFLPYAAIRGAGLDLVELKSTRDPVPAGAVGFAFAGAEINGAAWVHRRLAAAAAVSDQDWENVSRAPGPIKDQLTVIATSKPVLRSVLNLRKGLAPAVKARLVEILIAAQYGAEVKKVGKAYNKIAKFDALDATALQSLSETYRLLRAAQAPGL